MIGMSYPHNFVKTARFHLHVVYLIWENLDCFGSSVHFWYVPVVIARAFGCAECNSSFRTWNSLSSERGYDASEYPAFLLLVTESLFHLQSRWTRNRSKHITGWYTLDVIPYCNISCIIVIMLVQILSTNPKTELFSITYLIFNSSWIWWSRYSI